MRENKSSYWQLESSSSLIIEFVKFVLWVDTIVSSLWSHFDSLKLVVMGVCILGKLFTITNPNSFLQSWLLNIYQYNHWYLVNILSLWMESAADIIWLSFKFPVPFNFLLYIIQVWYYITNSFYSNNGFFNAAEVVFREIKEW